MQSAVALSRVGTSWFAKDIDLEDIEGLDDLIDQLDAVDSEPSGIAVVFVEEDDEWLGMIRVTSDSLQDPGIFLSDGRVLVTSPLAERLFGDALPVLAPVDDADEETAGRPEATPVGDPELLAALGTPGDVLVEVVAEDGALPSDVIATLCERAGCLDVLDALRGA